MVEYTVEFTVTVRVWADDVVEAVEQAKGQADLKDAAIFVDGNWY